MQNSKSDHLAHLKSLAVHLRNWSVLPEDAEAVVWAIQKIEALEKLETVHPTYCVNCGHVAVKPKAKRLGLPMLAVS